MSFLSLESESPRAFALAIKNGFGEVSLNYLAMGRAMSEDWRRLVKAVESGQAAELRISADLTGAGIRCLGDKVEFYARSRCSRGCWDVDFSVAVSAPSCLEALKKAAALLEEAA